MEKGDMRIPCWRGVRSKPKRMITREPTVVRISLVDEDQPARRRRVPRVSRNHVQRGSQLSFARFIHAIDPHPRLSILSPFGDMSPTQRHGNAVDNASYAGLRIAFCARNQD